MSTSHQAKSCVFDFVLEQEPPLIFVLLSPSTAKEAARDPEVEDWVVLFPLARFSGSKEIHFNTIAIINAKNNSNCTHRL